MRLAFYFGWRARGRLEQTKSRTCGGRSTTSASGLACHSPSFYIIESPAPNAFATGLDPHHASLAVTRGLLSLLDHRELEGVIAHEVSHIGNYDTRLNTVVAAGVALLRLPFLIMMGFFRFLFRLHWAVGVGAVLYVVVPALAGIPFAVDITIDVLGSDPLQAVVLLFSSFLPFYVLFGAPASWATHPPGGIAGA